MRSMRLVTLFGVLALAATAMGCAPLDNQQIRSQYRTLTPKDFAEHATREGNKLHDALCVVADHCDDIPDAIAKLQAVGAHPRAREHVRSPSAFGERLATRRCSVEVYRAALDAGLAEPSIPTLERVLERPWRGTNDELRTRPDAYTDDDAAWVGLLLERGLKAQSASLFAGGGPMSFLGRRGSDYDAKILKAFVDAGVDPNGDNGLLQRAVRSCNERNVALILSLNTGAKRDFTNRSRRRGDTPFLNYLGMCSEEQRVAIRRHLLNAGAPTRDACVSGTIREIEQMLDAGADPNMKCPYPGGYAIDRADDDAKVRLLMKRGARGTETSLNRALDRGSDALALSLIQSGITFGTGSLPNGDSALHHAARKRRARVVEALLRAGRPANAANMFGELPADAAIAGGDGECLRLLEAAGAVRGDPAKIAEAKARHAREEAEAQRRREDERREDERIEREEERERQQEREAQRERERQQEADTRARDDAERAEREARQRASGSSGSPFTPPSAGGSTRPGGALAPRISLTPSNKPSEDARRRQQDADAASRREEQQAAENRRRADEQRRAADKRAADDAREAQRRATCDAWQRERDAATTAALRANQTCVRSCDQDAARKRKACAEKSCAVGTDAVINADHHSCLKGCPSTRPTIRPAPPECGSGRSGNSGAAN